MKPEFPRANFAISSVLHFYEIGYIEDYLCYWSGKQSWWEEYSQNWIDYALKSFERMGDEISQTIHTTNHNTQVELFEFLRAWMNDYRIAVVAVDEIVAQLDEENEKRLRKYQEEVEKKTEEYFKSDDRKRAHLEVYTPEVMPWRYIGGTVRFSYDRLFYSEPEPKTNYNFYCVEERPDLIPDEFLERYFGMVEYLTNEFKTTIRPYLERYDSGKIVGNSQVSIETLLVHQRALAPAQDDPNNLTNGVQWMKTDTDFLEWITAFMETQSIQNKNGDLTRADAIKAFAKFFGIEIKDAESKLARATERKTRSPYLTSLKDAFDKYCEAKDEK